MDLKSQLPMLLRYLIVTAATSIATRGLLSPESAAIVSGYADAIAGALIVLGTVAYALIVRPSAKALEVAKEVDAKVPAGSPVVIKTPVGIPDIEVPGTRSSSAGR